MRFLLLVILLTPMISFALPVAKGERFRVAIPGEFIIQSYGEKISHDIKQKLGHNLFLIQNVGPQKSLLGMKSVHPNYVYYGEYKEGIVEEKSPRPDDDKFKKQFHHELIGTLKAWDVTTGDKDIIIAVTDNEFQIDHLDMKTAWWTNDNEVPGNGIDDDGNGYIDDIVGWDFIGNDNNVDSTIQPTHGTHVSGTIAATANNKIGGSGIAPGVKVMALKWYGGGEWTSAVISETYHYAVDNGAKIISTSYNIDGMVDDLVYLEAVKYAKDNGVLVFNSAGNSNTLNPPRQAVQDVILVCSVKSSKFKTADIKSKFSNHGNGIDICAPGDPIYAPAQAIAKVAVTQDKYKNSKGTSMATPVAAAVAALIWSAHPNFSAEEVKQRLYDSAKNIDSKNPLYKGQLGAGRVDAGKSVQ